MSLTGGAWIRHQRRSPSTTQRFYQRLGFDAYEDVMTRLDRGKLYDHLTRAPTWAAERIYICVVASAATARSAILRIMPAKMTLWIGYRLYQ